MKISKCEWIFFDVGSTLVDEEEAYRHRLRDVAEAVNEIALERAGCLPEQAPKYLLFKNLIYMIK